MDMKTVMQPVRVTADIAAIHGATLKLTAHLYRPEGTPSGMLFFCLPGGGASHDYYNLPKVQETDHSFAARMAARGHNIITMDHPGTGTNPLPADHPFLTPRQASDYLAEAFQKICDSHNLGDLTAFGVGHSMGGMTITLIQARHAPFCAIALLGSSARGLDWGTTEEEKAYIGDPDALKRDLEKLILSRFGSPFPEIAAGPSGKSITFGGINAEITLRENMVSLFAAGGTTSMLRGSFECETKAIKVPIFFAFGDHDIGAPPEDVPQDYPAAESIELHVLENCGHNSFAFPAITEICSKLSQWASRITA